MVTSVSRWCLAAALSALFAVTVRADTAPAEAAVVKCDSVSGALLRQRQGEKWQPVKAGDAVQAGDLLVALPKAELLSPDGAVQMLMLADIGQRGPFPILETGVIVNAPSGVSLDVTLDRGMIGFVNLKEKGAAKVRLRFRGEVWDINLIEPGTLAGLEIHSRQIPGMPDLVQGKAIEPVSKVAFLVRKGRAFVDTPSQGTLLTEPPGPAMLQWDSLSHHVVVHRLEKLPESLQPQNAKEKKEFDAVCAAARRLNTGDLQKGLDELLASDDPIDRMTGLTAAGAVDDVLHIRTGFLDTKHPDTRDQAVLVSRHWIGRGPDQVNKLLAAVKKAGLSEVRARIVLQLLFGFNGEELRQPETYELLIGYLNHEAMPIRELARWHLIRLAPAGRQIPYDAAAPEAQRQAAIQRWQALIPPGRVPENVAEQK